MSVESVTSLPSNVPSAPTAGSTRGDLRVVMLTSQFLPEVFGGAEQQCLRLSRALSVRGVSPHILTSRYNTETPGEEVIDGIKVTRLHAKHPPQMGGPYTGSTVRWMHDLRRWFGRHRGQVDLIHCHQAKVNAWAGIRNAKRLGVPAIVKLGSAGPNLDFFSLEKKKYLWGKWAAREVARDMTRVIGISDEMEKDLITYGIEDSRRVRIPNGVEVPDWARPGRDSPEQLRLRAQIRAKLGLTDDDTMLLFVGRMEVQKNVETLLRAFAPLAERAHLVLLGDGELMDGHQALAAEMGIAPRCHFEGRVDNVIAYQAATDFFVLPAIAEGMSNALLEAMAAGSVPVASEVSGNTDLVTDAETGIMYAPPRDVAALTAALKRAFDLSPEARSAMSAAGHLKIRDFFSMDAVADRYITLYKSILPSFDPHQGG